MFPGERGTIFDMQIKLSGSIPQVCLLFGPSAAGGAYIPAFCDVVFMVNKNASMYLGSPRMAELVINEKVTLEEMGGARMHCSQSGNGDMLCKTEEEALDACMSYLGYLPSCAEDQAPLAEPVSAADDVDLAALIPDAENAPFDIKGVINGLIDEGSFFEIKQRFAKIVTGFARLERRSVLSPTTPSILAVSYSKIARIRRLSLFRSVMPSVCLCCSWPTFLVS